MDARRFPSIVVYAPDGTQQRIALGPEPVTFGRADTCGFVLRDDAEVSREHAEIWVDDAQRVVVRDKGSKNGTRADDGDIFRGENRFAYRAIRIGEHELRIVDGITPATTPVQFTPDAPTVGDTQFFPSTRGLDLNEQRLQLLIRLTERIGGVFERKQLLEQAIDACCEALGFERGLIALKTARGDTEHPVTRNVQRDETGAFKVSRTLINRAMNHGERAIVNNPATDVPNLSESLVRFPICSALCVPILNRGDVLGVIYGDRITQASTYEPADVDFLAAIAQQVGVGLANLRLFHEHVRSQRMYAELDRARVIQRQLLPDQRFELGRVAIEGLNEPSSAVSGDYYDYFELSGNRVGFVIADVTGHGLPAALLMANIQAAVRVALAAAVDLPRLGDQLNKLICRNTASNVFITAIVGTVDAATGEIHFINAGHMPPLLFTGNGPVAASERASLPFGIEEDEKYETVRIPAETGLRAAFLFTDGVTEACDPTGNMLGIEPVTEALQQLGPCTPDRIIQAGRAVVRRHLHNQSPTDDTTLLAITLGD